MNTTTRLSEKDRLDRRGFLVLGASTLALPAWATARLAADGLPKEPLAIGHEPQFLFDLQVVDCTWGLRSKGEPVKREYHQPKKHKANPLIPGDDQSASWLWVRRDGADGPFRMWYQCNQPTNGGERLYQTCIAYAESKDGLRWEKPALDLLPKAKPDALPFPRNAVWHSSLLDPAAVRCEAGGPMIVEAPEKDRRGYRYLMFYQMSKTPLNGLRLIGSKDGIHWDPKSDTLISKIPSDHPNTIVYDPQREEYVMFLRAKQIYRALGQDKEMINSGESRRGIARMTNRDLWKPWPDNPQTILTPDELDSETKFNYFMGMTVSYRAGVYWGFVYPFRWNDLNYTELCWSRDGMNFQRLPRRPKLIEYGPEGSWDSKIIFGSPSWVEVGDEWWIYYNGSDGDHNARVRQAGVGLVTVRKEGFISLRASKDGGVVCTRTLEWPGGGLSVNAEAKTGELRVRVSDERRKPLAGFDYPDCVPFTGDNVAHEVKWKDKSIASLKGKAIRLEFQLRDADLYTFRATKTAE